MTAAALRPAAAGSLRAACWAVRGQFFALGFAAGTWGVQIPAAKRHYGLDAGGVSLALLAAAVGAVACLVLAGRVVAALGARTVALAAGLVMCGALALVLHGSVFAALVVLMLAFGAGSALFDVAINAEGTLLEARGGRMVMSGFHGMFSLGGMAGAGAGALLIAAAVPPATQLVALCAALALAVVACSAFMLPFEPVPPDAHAGFRLPRGTLLVLGALAAIGLLAEGAIYDWSVLYLQQETGAAPALAALGYASFSAAMAAARFGGDALRERFAAPRLLAASAGIATAAMALVLLVRDPWVAIAGFALVGAGFANVVPILFMAATRVPGTTPAAGIAAVSSVGYLGLVAGPALVGGVAHATSLGAGLSLVVAGAALLGWAGRRLPG